MNGYIAQVRLAIQAKFYNADMYRGKTCTLEINITDKGTLISVNAVGGDDGLCRPHSRRPNRLVFLRRRANRSGSSLRIPNWTLSRNKL